MRGTTLILASTLLWGGCASQRAVTELWVQSPAEVGLAVPPADPDPQRWLAPPGNGPFEARARLVSPSTGVSEAPEVEVRRQPGGALTLLCRPCARGWIDVVDAEGHMVVPGPDTQLRRENGQVLVPMRVLTGREIRGGPEGDVALETRTFADLVALVPEASVQKIQRRIISTRPRSWTTTGVLAGSGLLVGGAGILMLSNGQDGRRWPGGALLGVGLSMIAGAVVEALLPRSQERLEEHHW